jgi:hypothetical protein
VRRLPRAIRRRLLATLAHEVEHAAERDEQPSSAHQYWRAATAGPPLSGSGAGRGVAFLGGLVAACGCGAGSGSVAAAGASAAVWRWPPVRFRARSPPGGSSVPLVRSWTGLRRSAPAASPALRCGPRACASLPRARSRAAALWSAGRRPRPTTGVSSKPLRCPAPVSPAAGARSRPRRPRCLPARPGTVLKPPRRPPTR